LKPQTSSSRRLEHVRQGAFEYSQSSNVEFQEEILMSEVAAVGTGNFENEVVQASQLVVVDFWAEWCQPCKMLSPVLDKVADKFNGQLKVVKCNVDENQDIAMKYGVMSIPNLIFFKDGQVVNQAVGYMNESQLSAKVDEVLGS
jgi:thioredoxin 1